jgi:hypothetical protein
MMTDEFTDYTPETLRTLAQEINAQRMDMLVGVSDAGADPESEQFYLLALGALDSAYRFMTMAAMKQSQGIVKRII